MAGLLVVYVLYLRKSGIVYQAVVFPGRFMRARACKAETPHSKLAAKMHFAHASFGRTRLAPPPGRAFQRRQRAKRPLCEHALTDNYLNSL